VTRTATPTNTPTRSWTPTWTQTNTATSAVTVISPSATQTFTMTPTHTATPTLSPTFTSSPTDSMTPTASLTATPTVSPSSTLTYTPTRTPSFTATHSPTFTPSITNTVCNLVGSGYDAYLKPSSLVLGVTNPLPGSLLTIQFEVCNDNQFYTPPGRIYISVEDPVIHPCVDGFASTTAVHPATWILVNGTGAADPPATDLGAIDGGYNLGGVAYSGVACSYPRPISLQVRIPSELQPNQTYRIHIGLSNDYQSGADSNAERTVHYFMTGEGTPTPTWTPAPAPAPGCVRGRTRIFPSPIKNKKATVRCDLCKPAHYEIRVFNAVGELVLKHSGRGDGVVHANLEMGSFATGVYLYLLDIRYDDGERDTLGPLKFAVVR